MNATLIVRETQLMDTPFYGTIIDGTKKTIVKNGTKINLFCTSTFSIFDEIIIDRQINWSMNDTPITFQAARGGINIFTEWSTGLKIVTSNLTIVDVNENDSGIYKCSVTDNGSDFIELSVVAGKKSSSETSNQQENNSMKKMPLKNFVIQIILVMLLLLLQ